MKLNIIKYLVILSICISATSCSWFDINPKTDVKANLLFNSENGYESALTGIYLTCANKNSYGGNWTFKFMDQIMGRYDNVPIEGNNTPTSADLETMNELRKNYFVYNNDINGFNAKRTTAEMWSASYKAIVNINNLIKYLDLKGKKVIENHDRFNFYYGQALALRALLHFDLLRAWGPIYSLNPEQKSIPYRVKSDGEKLPLLPAKEVVKKILDDLNKAEDMLSFEKVNTFQKPEYGENNAMFRINYWAIKALKARVYNYAGQKDEAFKNAKDVVDNCGLSLMTTNLYGPLFPKEVLFALQIYKMDQNYTSEFSENRVDINHFFCFTPSLDLIFDKKSEGVNDIRANGNEFKDVEVGNKYITIKYLRPFFKNREDLYAIPLIRLSEMYYILCENAPLDQANEYINAVMEVRGVQPLSQFTTEDERLSALEKEYRKEFYAEGQYFYFAKNHNLKSFIRSPKGKEMQEADYIFPLPDREKEFGWTLEDNNENK